VTGADSKLVGLADEAIWLARLLTELMPSEPEAIGLLSMMLHCGARRLARRNAEGAFVPLRHQDPALWSRPMIAEAEALLRKAAAMASPGRFQT
jgi:RNA polymerase sigma-70 factor (ECF subfamily)